VTESGFELVVEQSHLALAEFVKGDPNRSRRCTRIERM
jgi:hypothetical protein